MTSPPSGAGSSGAAKMRAGRWTKPPISPHTGRYANVTDPQDWGTRDEAETAVTALLNGKGSGGIGIVLGDLDGDVFLAGIDFDACVDQNNCLALWAERLLAEIDSYAERSPSGTGVKSFFNITAPGLRSILANATSRSPPTVGSANLHRSTCSIGQFYSAWPRSLESPDPDPAVATIPVARKPFVRRSSCVGRAKSKHSRRCAKRCSQAPIPRSLSGRALKAEPTTCTTCA